MPVKVQVRGLDQLKRELATLSASVAGRLSRNAAMAGARVAARHAKQLAPVETGALRASIRAMRDPNWRTQTGQKVALAGSKLFYSRFIELGTAKMPARSFLRAAADTAAAEIRAKIEENLSRGIDRELRKNPPPEDPGDERGVI